MDAKGAKVAVEKQKEPYGDPKSENPLYLSNYDYVRPKNQQMLRTNWYNCFRKGFIGKRVRKNWLLGAKGAKLAVEQQKGPSGGPKLENPLYLSNYDSVRRKNWQMLIINWYNYFRKKMIVYRVHKN